MKAAVIVNNKRHVTYRITDLVRQVRAMAHAYDVISFDVFDTLLVRRNHDPDQLKLATARYISSLAAEAGICVSPEKVQRTRDKVEAMHRRRAARQHTDHEACYPVFMADTLKLLFKEKSSENLLEQVTEYELSIESAFLVARSEFLDLAVWLKEKGKRLVAVSDMYLPATHIERLLDRAGFAGTFD